MALLERAAADRRRSRLVAVGECGLDYHYDHSPRDGAARAFAEQVALAHQHGLALVIHARDAWDDLFDVLGAEGVPERTVLHCFTGGPTEARRCLDAGMYVSFSGIVDLQERRRGPRGGRRSARRTACWWRPTARSWRRCPTAATANEPAFVPLVGAAVAEARGTAGGGARRRAPPPPRWRPSASRATPHAPVRHP